MNEIEIIIKKRNKSTLNFDEISYMVNSYTQGKIKDYQMSAFLMACLLNGLNTKETSFLTQIMLESGKKLDYQKHDKKNFFIDKHSTGGVGDKTSFVIAPLVACEGLYDPMISGRGLGHTGGTLDKLESIKGFNVNLKEDEFKKVLFECGYAMMGQTEDIAPADKKIYALRDSTGCAESIELITASILSKKLAEGLDALIIDTKMGSGAFMKNLSDSRKLAQSIVSTAKELGLKTMSLISDMSSPLGYTVGNFFEIEEIINCLNPNNYKKYWDFEEKNFNFLFLGPCKDMMEVSLKLVANMYVLSGKVKNEKLGMDLAIKNIQSGDALEKFMENVELQGGDLEWLDKNLGKFRGKFVYEYKAKSSGIISNIDAYLIGFASVLTGAGRMKKEDFVEKNTGIIFHKKNGDKISAEETIFEIHYNEESKLDRILSVLSNSVSISDEVNSFKGIIEKID